MKQTISFSVLEEKGKIVEINLNKKSKTKKETKLEKECRRQINEYISGKRKKFDVKLKFSGTHFQEKVWKEMQKIPYGKTLSYGELAARIGKPKAYRAVANACGKNPLPIIIPCHRVVASDGLGGYSAGIEIKKKLLLIEKKKN
ncbi:MAG: methylated-DNA--[protein]-cysteine S-methyltransferase [Candidatus Nanoarchaeia archaeon]